MLSVAFVYRILKISLELLLRIFFSHIESGFCNVSVIAAVSLTGAVQVSETILIWDLVACFSDSCCCNICRYSFIVSFQRSFSIISVGRARVFSTNFLLLTTQYWKNRLNGYNYTGKRPAKLLKTTSITVSYQ